ncbi:hypothetical protein Rs2_35564 [Raphanus sativus]|nr:hypothetical protein Rs2_35564 [Raphanus sativus]
MAQGAGGSDRVVAPGAGGSDRVVASGASGSDRVVAPGAGGSDRVMAPAVATVSWPRAQAAATVSRSSSSGEHNLTRSIQLRSIPVTSVWLCHLSYGPSVSRFLSIEVIVEVLRLKLRRLVSSSSVSCRTRTIDLNIDSLSYTIYFTKKDNLSKKFYKRSRA